MTEDEIKDEIPQISPSTKNRFSMKYRPIYFAAGVAVFVLAYYVGAAIPLSDSDAEDIRSSFTEKAQATDQLGIFQNNVLVGLAMFVPGVGVGVGIYSGASTGMVFHALVQGLDSSTPLSNINPLAILATPFGILEILAYGIAIWRSGMLVAQLALKQIRINTIWKRIALYTGIEVGIVVAALAAGSVIEWQEITANAAQ